MLRFIMIFTIASILLAGCTKDDKEMTKQKIDSEEEQVTQEDSGYTEVTTEDGRITFQIYNLANLSKQQLNILINRDILKGYQSIKETFETEYDPPKEIKIYLRNGKGPSTSYKESLSLVNGGSGAQFPIVHELTHTILGKGDNLGSKSTPIQEGFATYMENNYGTQYASVDDFMDYLIYIDKNIPLANLFNDKYTSQLFSATWENKKDRLLQIMSYNESASFVTFLIKTYGMDKFSELYKLDNIEGSFNKVYDKNLNEIEKEWLKHLVPSPKALAEKFEIKNSYFETQTNTINQMDQSIFQREKSNLN